MSETMVATGDSVVTMLSAQKDALVEQETELAEKLAAVRERKRRIDGALRLLNGTTAANGSKRRVRIDARVKRAKISAARQQQVLDALLKQPDREWTIPLVVAETGVNQATVNIAFHNLRDQGRLRLAGKQGNLNIWRVV